MEASAPEEPARQGAAPRARGGQEGTAFCKVIYFFFTFVFFFLVFLFLLLFFFFLLLVLLLLLLCVCVCVCVCVVWCVCMYPFGHFALCRKRDELENLLRSISMEREKICTTMVWCMDNSESADEVMLLLCCSL